MTKTLERPMALVALALLVLAAGRVPAQHGGPMPGVIDGVHGTATTAPDGTTIRTYALTTHTGHVSTPDGNSVFIWGFAHDMGAVQYPGPTLIAHEGDTVQVELTNHLSVPVSIVFPGQEGVSAAEVAAPTADGVLAREAGPGGTVRYSFVAAQPGTYSYHSGTDLDIQVEMGLVGALIVRPHGFDPMDPANRKAYEHADSQYDVEYLFLITEMDLRVHRFIEQGRLAEVDTTDYFPVQWFYNGRCAPDTMFEAFASWLPTQPYNCMPMMEPGQKLLMRVIGGGRDLHPHHHHGNHSRVIARDGRLLESAGGAGADLRYDVFTVMSVPGQTVDSIFTWTGEGIGWDVYGHGPGDPLAPSESVADHGKPFPVLLPENLDLVFGGMWSGSPFLGAMGALPPGEGGLNPTGGYTFMWHSHTEKEMCNNDIFPGGMMTMLLIVPPGTPMPGMPLEPGMNPFFGGRN